ncbi:MAG: QueT transporter family protein [Lachnospiraceae bacterium]|nr:QueT transporter family protein [Lachnospiraceae bacterium]
MKESDKKIKQITQAAVIAAIYVILTFVANALGLASGVIQVRISEALTILPYFTPAAIPGLFVGCVLANILTGCLPLDVVFGSLATLLGAFWTYYLRKLNLPDSKARWLAPLPPIVANTLIVPFVLAFVYQFEGSIAYFMLTVGAGEVISCGVFGAILFGAFRKYDRIF